jgi:hypothetical protein
MERAREDIGAPGIGDRTNSSSASDGIGAFGIALFLAATACEVSAQIEPTTSTTAARRTNTPFLQRLSPSRISP